MKTFTEARPAALPPPLKWAGGKRWLLPYLRPLYEPHRHRRLVEPFCGGLSVTLGLLPERALLNDVNPHLINFFRQLKAGFKITLPLANDRELYYRYRARFNQLVRAGQADTPEAAQLFYYLNKTCYNGLCRFNRKGEFNVPFGRYVKLNYYHNFSAYQRVLKNWELTCADFEAIPLEADDFVYADPPYDVGFCQYAPAGFTWADQVRLARWLARHPGPVVISNHATERVCRLYAGLGFELRLVPGPRRISCTGNRRPAWEVLAINSL